MVENQRQFERRALPVEFRGADAHGAGQLWFEAADLSVGGTFLKSDLLLEAGEQLWLEFRVPGAPRSMHAQARVAWVRRFPGEQEAAGMGMEFTAVPDEDRQLLTRYLTSGHAGPG